jgi:hypothetical protein
MPRSNCRGCGRSISAEARTCPSCGKAIPAADATPVRISVLTRFSIAGFVVILIAAAVGWSLIRSETETARLESEHSASPYLLPLQAAPDNERGHAKPRTVEAVAPPTAQRASCDISAANKVLDLMSDPTMARVTHEDNWVIVHFGTDYASWSSG